MHFNSYMVQLKQEDLDRQVSMRLFQFLYGPIKAIRLLGPITLYAMHFNSYMVQLKLNIGSSIAVPLKNFNSYMVQIKQYASRKYLYYIHLFQFLYGPIKAFAYES